MIRLKSKELRKKTSKELIEMKKQMEIHLQQAYMPMKGGFMSKEGVSTPTKGFNPKEEKKNIARINTILRERNY